MKKCIDNLKREYATRYKISKQEYDAAKQKATEEEFWQSYEEDAGDYYYLEYPDDAELKAMILDDRLGEISNDIKFFKGLTIAGIVIVTIVFIMSLFGMLL